VVEVHRVFGHAARGGSGVIYLVALILLLAAPFLFVLGCALILSSRISRDEEERYAAYSTADAMFARREGGPR
jgi:outer membrane lipoprotein-sorting protein